MAIERDWPPNPVNDATGRRQGAGSPVFPGGVRTGIQISYARIPKVKRRIDVTAFESTPMRHIHAEG